MPKSFIVAPLPAGDLALAFPVVQPVHPAMTLAEWQAMAAPFAAPDARRGIVACRMGRGHVRGLYCHALDDTATLRVSLFAVAGLFDARATAEALVEAIDQTARQGEAARIVVEPGGLAATTVSRCDLPALFRKHGYRPEGGALVRDGTAAEPRTVTASA